jgi:hypothetical protein
VRTRLRSAAGLALTGLFFAAMMSVWVLVSDDASWPRALIQGAIAGAVYTPLMWFATRADRRGVNAIMGAMTSDEQRAVLSAAKTGVPPAEAALRPAAVSLVRHRLAEHDRHRVLTLVVFAAFALLSVPFIFTDGLWWLVATAMFASMLVWTVRYPSQLARRLARLEPPAPALQARTSDVH